MKKNPWRVFEPDSANIANLGDANYMLDFNKIKTIFFYNIYNIYISRYIWDGLPPEIQPYYIESTLFWRASGVFIYDDIAEMYAFMKVALQGMPDIYNIPKGRTAFAPNGYIEEYGKDNSVILWDNPATLPFCYEAEMYACRLANVWKTKDINIFAQRTPVVLVSSSEQRLTFQTLGEQYANYVPILKVSDNVDLDRIKALNIDAPYIVDKLEEEIRAVKSSLLTSLGYESNPIEKRERLVVGETQGNNGETEANRNVGLDLRKRCANAMNELWGLNVDVRFNSKLPSMVNGFIPDSFTQTGKIGEEGGEIVE